MDDFIIKDILSLDGNLSIKECRVIVGNQDFALGILDENRELASFVLRESLDKMIFFGFENKPVSLIASPSKIYSQEEAENVSEHSFFVYDGEKYKLFIRSCIPAPYINLLHKYEQILPSSVKKALSLCSKAADEINMPVYLIGGVVRDLIMGKASVDTDISVEENAVEFAEFMKKKYGELVDIKEIHDDFKTVKMLFHVEEDVQIDIASTREETYPYPSSLPSVKNIGCSLEADVVRRDFSINAMAVSLNKQTFGNLVDYLGGYEDMKNRSLKILHPLSFVDDPSRILRGLKFSARFDYSPDEKTKYLEKQCLESGIFDNLATDRIKLELRQTLNLNMADVYDRFLSEGIYRLVSTDFDVANLPEGKVIFENIEKYGAYLEDREHIWLIYLGVMCASLEKEQILELSKKMNLSGVELKVLLYTNSIVKHEEEISKFETMFDVYEFFECYFNESVAAAVSLFKNNRAREFADVYLNKLQFITINTTGKDLIARNMTPSPLFGEILRDILKEKINGNIKTPEEESIFVDKVLGKR